MSLVSKLKKRLALVFDQCPWSLDRNQERKPTSSKMPPKFNRFGRLQIETSLKGCPSLRQYSQICSHLVSRCACQLIRGGIGSNKAGGDLIGIWTLWGSWSNRSSLSTFSRARPLNCKHTFWGETGNSFWAARITQNPHSLRAKRKLWQTQK